jgi:TolA-binding protein
MSSPAEEEGVPPEDVGAAAISMPPGVAAALRAMNERVAATEQRLAATEAKVQELELELAALRDGVGGDDDDDAASAPPAEPLMRDGREPPAGYTPGDLRQAAQGGDTKTLRELLEAGVNPMASQEMLAEWPPLHYAAQAGRLLCGPGGAAALARRAAGLGRQGRHDRHDAGGALGAHRTG